MDWNVNKSGHSFGAEVSSLASAPKE